MGSARPFLPGRAGPAPSILLPPQLRFLGKQEIPGKARVPVNLAAAAAPLLPSCRSCRAGGHLGEPGPSPAALGRARDVIVTQEILNKPGVKHWAEPRHRMTPAGSAGTPGHRRTLLGTAAAPDRGHGHRSAVPRSQRPRNDGTRGAGPEHCTETQPGVRLRGLECSQTPQEVPTVPGKSLVDSQEGHGSPSPSQPHSQVLLQGSHGVRTGNWPCSGSCSPSLRSWV